MAHMLLRPALLCFVLLAFAVPNASASFANRFLPVRDVADCVTVATSGGKTSAPKAVIRFGPKAATLYRGLAGRKALVGCGGPAVKDDGTTSVMGGSDIPTLIGRGGYQWTEQTLPRKRSRITTVFTRAADVCFVATPERKADDLCLPVHAGDDDHCVRVIVAVTEKGRFGIEERARALALDMVFGDLRERLTSNEFVVLGTRMRRRRPG